MTTHDEAGSGRWLRGLEAVAVFLAAACTVVRLAIDVKNGAGSLWWGERMAFAAGVLRGVDIYPGAHTGVITGDVYGPVLAAFYLPAALVPTITGKMLAGELSSLLVMLVPLAVLVGRVAPAGRGRLAARVVGMTLLAGGLATLPATSYQLSAIAADAPCLGLGMWSFVALTGAARPGYGRLAATAALVGLSTLTKPNGAFMAFALLLLVVYRSGWVKAAVFGALYVALTALLGVLIIRATGSTLAGVWLNDVVIPSSQFVHHELRTFVRGMGKLTLPMFGLLAVTVAPRFLRLEESAPKPYVWPALVLELWFIAWVLVPISYLGRAKAGGDVNSFHAHYFAVAGTVFAWAPAFAVAKYRWLRTLAFAVLSWATVPFGRGTVFGDWTDTTHERVFAYLRAHDEGFFPWHPLATLEATGQYLHQSDGVFSRQLAARAPTTEEFMAHAPRRPTFIGLPRVGPFLPEEFVFTELVTRYYPGYVLVPEPTPARAALRLQIFAPATAR